MPNDKLNVSLEPHLRDTLAPLSQILPRQISQKLASHLAPGNNATPIPVVIPYELILEISRWCQTSDGKAALQACSPPLIPHSYTMVSLLAGTRTSPEKRFPPYKAKNPEEEQRLRVKDRKAIATLVNAVLSILGTGIATFFASRHTGMQLEWRALSAVCAALVVAFAEIVLYMIWDSRQTPRPLQPTSEHILIRHKGSTENNSLSDIVPQASSTALGDTDLRRRTTTQTETAFS